MPDLKELLGGIDGERLFTVTHETCVRLVSMPKDEVEKEDDSALVDYPGLSDFLDRIADVIDMLHVAGLITKSSQEDIEFGATIALLAITQYANLERMPSLDIPHPDETQ